VFQKVLFGNRFPLFRVRNTNLWRLRLLPALKGGVSDAINLMNKKYELVETRGNRIIASIGFFTSMDDAIAAKSKLMNTTYNVRIVYTSNKSYTGWMQRA
jgi:hypothetical protein